MPNCPCGSRRADSLLTKGTEKRSTSTQRCRRLAEVERCSSIAEHQSHQLICHCIRRRSSIKRDRAEFEHLRLEDRPAVSDLLWTGFSAARRVGSVVRD